MHRPSATTSRDLAQGPAAALLKVLLLLLVLSLAFMQPAIDVLGFNGAPTDFIFLALAAVWLWTLLSGRAKFVWDNAYWLVGLYLVAMIASAAASDTPLRWVPKLLSQFYLLSLPVIVGNLVRTREDLRSVVWWWLAGTAIVAVVGIVCLIAFLIDPGSKILDYTRMHFGTLPPGSYLRLRLTFLNGNMACNYLTVSLMLLLLARRLGWVGKAHFLLLLGGVTLSALLTISPGLAGYGLAVALWVWLLLREDRPYLAKLFLVGGLLLALLGIVAMAVTPIIHPTAPFLINLPLVDVQLAPSGRLMIWMDAVKNFLAAPIFGRGIGADAVYVRYLSPSGQLQELADAHNSFLNIAVQAGVFGLTALTAFVVFVYRQSLPFRLVPRQLSVARVALGLAFLIAFAYNGIAGSFEDARHLWVLFGLFLAAKALDDAGPPSAASSTTRAVNGPTRTAVSDAD